MRALRIAWVVLALGLVAGLAGYLALGNDGATRWLFRGAQAALGGHVQYRDMSGSMRSGVRLHEVTLAFDGAQAQVAALEWSPDLGALWRGHVALGHITARGVQLTLDASTDDASGSPRSLPLLVVPGQVSLTSLRVLELDVVTADGASRHVDALRIGGHLSGSRLQVDELAANGARWAVNAALRLDFSGRAPLDGWWQGHARSADGTPWRLVGTLGGDLRRDIQAVLRVELPVQGRLAASIDTPLANGPWQVHMWMDRQSLAALQPALPPGLLSLDARARGHGTQADTALVYDLQATPAGSMNGRLDAHGTAGRWEVAAGLRGERPSSRIDLAGQVDLVAGATDVSLNWRDVRWPPAGAAQVTSPSGSAHLTGGLTNWLLTLDAALQARGQVGALTARVAGDTSGASVQQFTAKALGGDLNGQGRVLWSPGLRYEFGLRATDFDPGLLLAQWPGKVDAVLAVVGQDDRVDLRLSQLGGQLRGQSLAGGGALHWQPGALRLDEVAVSMGRARLRADGQLGGQLPLMVDLSVPAAEQVWPGARGSATAKLRLDGPDLTRVHLRLNGAGLAYGDLAAHSLQVDVDLDRPQDAMNVRLNARAVAVGEQRLGLHLAAKGRASAHSVQIQVDGAGWDLALGGRGAVLGDGWQGSLDAGTLSGLPPSAWVLASPLALELRRDRQTAGQHCWQAQDSRLCSEADRIGQALHVAARIDALPLAPLTRWMAADATVDGALSGYLDLRRDDGPLLGDISLTIPAGNLNIPAPDGDVRRFAHGGARARGQFTAAGGNLHAHLAAPDGAGELFGAMLNVPALPVAPGSQLPLQGRVSAQLPNIGVIEPWLTGIEELAGRFEAQVHIAGSLSAPQVSGRMNVHGASAALPGLGIELRDVAAELRGDDGQTLSLSSSGKSGAGSLSLRGDGHRAADGRLQATFRLAGEQFQIIDTAALQARVSPAVDVNMVGKRLMVSGSVQVPHARISAVEQPAAVRRSPDVVVRGRAEPQVTTLAAEANVRVELGDDVRVSAYGFDGSLGGALQLRQRDDGAASVSGEVRVKNGQYEFYGQRLPVTQGVLLFAGGPPDNPGLRITAARKVGDVTAGVRLRGTAKAPQTQLFSAPTMPQSEILSYLVLGRPLQDASSAQGDLLMQAASSIGLRGGGALAKRLGQALGFDEAKLGADGTGGANLSLGRYLTPRLYVGYGLALAEQTNAATLRYTLSEHWILEVLSGLTQTADLLYKIER